MRTKIQELLKLRVLPLSKFRANLSAMLDLAERGETMRILRQSTPVAELQPVSPHARYEAIDGLPSWKRPFEPVKLPPGVTLSQAVLDERQNGLM